ncbi:MAG: hypothetical protein ACI8W7_002551 [Gammaproteobacteria bacterium]|jgi:hypothetical protein
MDTQLFQPKHLFMDTQLFGCAPSGTHTAKLQQPGRQIRSRMKPAPLELTDHDCKPTAIDGF